MRTPTGEYRVDFFDKYGKRIVGTSLIAHSFKQSSEFAEDRLLVPCMYEHSYTISRCVFNSLDEV